MVVVSYLAMTSRVVSVGFLAGHFFEHGIEQEVQSGVTLDHLLELFDHRVEIFGVAVDMFDGILKPFLLDAVVWGKPSTCPRKLSATLIRASSMLCQTCAYGVLWVC